MDTIREAAIALFDRYTQDGAQGGMDRRAFMKELTLIAGSAAAANALLFGIVADPAAAAVTAADDTRLTIKKGPLGTGSKLKGYVVAPKNIPKAPVIMVIHDVRGIDPYIEDMTRRIALAGYYAVAPDFLAATGGTPADPKLAQTAIEKLNVAATLASATAEVDRLRVLREGSGKVAAMGFGWGGTFVSRLAMAAGPKLNAGVVYYGPGPEPAEPAKVKAAMQFHFAALDTRTNETGQPWADALLYAKAKTEDHFYFNVEHEFSNDASDWYNKDAADIAWQRTLTFLKRELA